MGDTTPDRGGYSLTGLPGNTSGHGSASNTSSTASRTTGGIRNKASMSITPTTIDHL